MKHLILSLLVLTSVSARAYEFSFQIGQVFMSEADMKERMEKETAKINATFLSHRGLTAKITSVTKNSPTHTIKGEITGNGCLATVQFLERIDLTKIEFPAGVSMEVLTGMGFAYQHLPVSAQPGGEFNRTFILAPYCLK